MVEHCMLHGQPKDPKMQWSPNVVYIKTFLPERTKQPQPKPDPTDPYLNPPPVDPAIGNLLKELSSQPLESLQQLLLGLQLEVSKRELYPNPNPTPNPNSNLTPNLPPNNQPKASNPPGNPKLNNPNGNPPPNCANGSGNHLKLNEIVIEPDKLGVTIAKSNENLNETLAIHLLLRFQTNKFSQFSGNDLKGDMSFEHWEYEVETLL